MYKLGDFLIRIKNAALAGNKEVVMISSKKIMTVAIALKKLGFLDEIKKNKVALSFKDKKPVLRTIKLVSKPGLRVYINVRDLEKRKAPSILVISTPKGILSSKEAIKARIGGEVLAEIL